MQNTPHPPADLKPLIIAKLAELHTRKQTLKTMLAPYEQEIAIIEQASALATAEDVAHIEALESELKALALAHPVGCFGADRRSVTHSHITLGLRATSKVDYDGDEKTVKSSIVKAWRSHPEPKMQVAASLAVSVDYKLNKDSILDNWEVYGEEFSALGLLIVESDSASITEKKPARPKAPKAEKVKAIKGRQAEEGKSDE